MREAVIVSTARTPIGKAYRGAFNDTQAQTLGGHAIANALQRASVDPGEVDDVVMGAALQQGSRAAMSRDRRYCGRDFRPASPACRSTANAPLASWRSPPPQRKSSTTA